MTKKSIRFYNDREVRAVWDEEHTKWWFSAIDIVRAINDEPDYVKAGNYWRWLKRKLTAGGVQLVSVTHDFKSTIYLNGKRFMKPVEIKATVRDGDVLMDMGGNLSGSVEGAGYALPKRLAVGLELPTGEAKVKAGNINMTQNTTFHKVVAREEVTVPAGTYDCYVVERQYTAEMAGMTVKSTIKTWYARGVGTVKSETYGEDGTLSSGSHLLEFKK